MDPILTQIQQNLDRMEDNMRRIINLIPALERRIDEQNRQLAARNLLVAVGALLLEANDPE